MKFDMVMVDDLALGLRIYAFISTQPNGQYCRPVGGNLSLAEALKREVDAQSPLQIQGVLDALHSAGVVRRQSATVRIIRPIPLPAPPELERLHEENEQLREDLKAAEALTAEAEAAESRAAEAQAEARRLQGELDALQELIEAEAHEHAGAIGQLEAQLTDLQVEVELQREELTALRRQLSEEQQAGSRAAVQIQRLEGQAAGHCKRLEQFTAQLQAKAGELQRANSAATHAEEALHQARELTDQAQAQLRRVLTGRILHEVTLDKCGCIVTCLAPSKHTPLVPGSKCGWTALTETDQIPPEFKGMQTRSRAAAAARRSK
jgi:DNA repair exonuclease SbcCD ATPase subunit